MTLNYSCQQYIVIFRKKNLIVRKKNSSCQKERLILSERKNWFCQKERKNDLVREKKKLILSERKKMILSERKKKLVLSERKNSSCQKEKNWSCQKERKTVLTLKVTILKQRDLKWIFLNIYFKKHG